MNPKPASMFAFAPALLQDRREVLTATSARVTQTLGRASDLAIFPGIWAHSCRRLLLNAHDHPTSHARAGGGCGRSSAISRKISWNICRSPWHQNVRDDQNFEPDARNRRPTIRCGRL